MPPAQTSGTPRSCSSSYQRLGALRPGVAARPVVDRDQAVHPRFEPLQRPAALGHVVVDPAAGGVRLLHHPARIAQRGDEEADALLQRHVHEALHPLLVDLGGAAPR